MPGPRNARPHRTKGSSVPRVAGVGVVLVLAVGGLAGYLASTHQPGQAPHQHQHSLSDRVLHIQTVGIIDFGPADDGDDFILDGDRPLKLLPTAGGVSFVAMRRSEFRAGAPAWTDNQMADGTDIFIYTATGQCLSAVSDPRGVRLAHCDLTLAQRWRPLDAATASGQAFAKYANAKTGRCLTAPARGPGPARLARCGRPRLKTQEIAFWWSA